LGSTRALSNSAGAITDTYNYESFGSLLNQTGTTLNDYLFTGEQFDSGLDNYYLRARYYNQNIGRFTQMDDWYGKSCTPITLNKYIYADDNPVTGTDPSGYFTLGGLGATSNIQGILTTTARATVRVFSGPNAGKAVKLTKQVGCFIGKQFVDRKTDRVEGHHPLQKSIGGSPDEQVLIYTARQTHQMLHTVQNMLFREKGLPPLNTSKAAFENFFSNNPAMRRVAFETSLQAARRVDKFCGYKGKKSFERSVRREIKRWLKQRGGDFD
jgi:RHS repeat-associated protein